MILSVFSIGVELLLDRADGGALEFSTLGVSDGGKSRGIFASVANPLALPCMISFTVACGKLDMCRCAFGFCTLAGFANDKSADGVDAADVLPDFGRQ
jgi:hypothetical protein